MALNPYIETFQRKSYIDEARRLKAEQEAQEKKAKEKAGSFNIWNATIDALTAWAATGFTNPLAAIPAAITSPRGEFDPVGAATQGIAQGTIASQLVPQAYGPAGEGLGELAGRAAGAFASPENIPTTAAYLQSFQPEQATAALGTAQQAQRVKRSDILDKFNNDLKARSGMIKNMTVEGQRTVLNDLLEENPEYRQFMSEIGEFKIDEKTKVGDIITTIGEVETPAGRQLAVVGTEKGTGEVRYTTPLGVEPRRLTAEEAGAKKKATLEAAIPFETQKKINDTFKQLSSDKVYDEANQKLASVSNVKALLQSGNPIATGTIKRQLAKLSGEVGRLTEEDVNAFGGSEALLRRLSSLKSKWTEGTFSEADKADMLELSNIMEQKSKQNLEDRARLYLSRLSETSDLTMGQINELINRELSRSSSGAVVEKEDNKIQSLRSKYNY